MDTITPRPLASQGRSEGADPASAGATRPLNVSIAIGTRNRAAAVRACLESLNAMGAAPNVAIDVVVADNGSTDDTRAVIESVARGSKWPIRYVLVPQRGVSNAKNAIIRASTADVIAFTDDDCLADSNWIATLVREFKDNPEVAVVCGRVALFDPRDAPITISVDRPRSYMTSRYNLLEGYIHGCNMAFRRSTLDAVGLFDPRLGPGTPCQAADETDILYRVFRRGMPILYSPDAVVYHNHGRRTASDIEAITKSYTIAKGAFYAKHSVRGDRRILTMFAFDLLNLLHIRKTNRTEAGKRFRWLLSGAYRRVRGVLADMRTRQTQAAVR
jgi:GT2 family glycosyltransferase